MGRQPKQGLDYFPFDVGLLSDPKLRRPRQKYGYLAQMIYSWARTEETEVSNCGSMRGICWVFQGSLTAG